MLLPTTMGRTGLYDLITLHDVRISVNTYGRADARVVDTIDWMNNGNVMCREIISHGNVAARFIDPDHMPVPVMVVGTTR